MQFMARDLGAPFRWTQISTNRVADYQGKAWGKQGPNISQNQQIFTVTKYQSIIKYQKKKKKKTINQPIEHVFLANKTKSHP
uniref:Uncharacterized protein n=1 Tax=Nelumbo nucifera TaxID=4432 RepID=A0A822YVF7_NELNU|nr:TPA_asm: hypothetical protein HUJ06_006733 [Nelumbo nucifera]